jgi:hypothetical protein
VGGAAPGGRPGVDGAGCTRDLLAHNGIECPTVTGAGTGSFEFEVSSTSGRSPPAARCIEPRRVAGQTKPSSRRRLNRNAAQLVSSRKLDCNSLRDLASAPQALSRPACVAGYLGQRGKPALFNRALTSLEFGRIFQAFRQLRRNPGWSANI